MQNDSRDVKDGTKARISCGVPSGWTNSRCSTVLSSGDHTVGNECLEPHQSEMRNILMHRNLLNSRSVPAMVSIDRWIEWTWITRLRVSGENQRSADFLELRKIV